MLNQGSRGDRTRVADSDGGCPVFRPRLRERLVRRPVHDPLLAVPREARLHEQLDVVVGVRAGHVKANGAALLTLSEDLLHEPEANLARARAELELRGARILRSSTIRETEPFGVTEQPLFLNQVLEVEWDAGPRDLLETAKAVEAAVGRTAGYRWGPREIDVDILLFGDLQMAEEGLTIPHPGLVEREFVRVPLAELRPDILA